TDAFIAANQDRPVAPSAPIPPAGKLAAPAAARAVIKPFQPNTSVFLFTPAAIYRTRYVAMSGRPDRPEYPPVGARTDSSPAAPGGDLKLEILDAAGNVVRSYTSGASAPSGGGRGGRRGGALPSSLPAKAGMNRFVWDLRYPGAASGGGDGEGGG